MAGPVDLKVVSSRVFKTRWGRIAYLAVALGVVSVASYGGCATYVRPNEFGIKQVICCAGMGIKPDVYRTGLHWVTPGAERMHRFPTDIQSLNLTNETAERGPDDARSKAPLVVQTSEGSKVSVDVSVLYRITDPYKVISQVGP